MNDMKGMIFASGKTTDKKKTNIQLCKIKNKKMQALCFMYKFLMDANNG